MARCVLVEGNKITVIATDVTALEGTMVIETDSRTLMPGLTIAARVRLHNQ